MSKIDEILDPIHCCGHIGTHNMEVEEDRQIVKQALYKDMLELIDEAIDKTKEDKDKTSLAHEPYSGSVDAYSYRIGWDLGLNNLRQEIRTKLKEYFGVEKDPQ